MPKKSRRKRTVTQPRSQSPVPATVTMKPSTQTQAPTTVATKPSSQTHVRAKDDFNDPARYSHIRSELKMIGIIGAIILAGIFILYFLLR